MPLALEELRQTITIQGYNNEQFAETIEFYIGCDVFKYTDAQRNAIVCIDDDDL